MRPVRLCLLTPEEEDRRFSEENLVYEIVVGRYKIDPRAPHQLEILTSGTSGSPVFPWPYYKKLEGAKSEAREIIEKSGGVKRIESL